jgi:phosphogluconate dehydratase
VTPEAAEGGTIARLRDGDVIRLDGEAGTLTVKVAHDELMRRDVIRHEQPQSGFGRELFRHLRARATGAEAGASVLY